MDSNMNITNEVLANKIENLSAQISELKLTVASYQTSFVPHDIFELRMKDLEARATSNQLAIVRLEARKSGISPAVTIVWSLLASLLTFLLVEYLKR